MAIKKSSSEKIFDVFNSIFMLLLIAVTLYPFLYVVFASLSDPTEMSQHRGILLLPRGFQIGAYKLVLKNPNILIGYKNTLFYVLVGTSFNILITSLLAYTLSRKGLLLNNLIMFLVVFTMFFGGGMIPTYLMMSDIGLMGTRWALIFPGLVSTMNLIIMRTNFMSIPESLEESARLDGANDIVILFKIILPLSMPVISVMVLFYGVGHWNSWFNAMLYLRKREMFPLQLVLREILIFSSTDDMMVSLGSQKGKDISEIIKYATIVVATVPILLVYPFLQKYFVKGIMVGAIKG
ncbi:MAG: binding-protein-dependent transport system inner rane component [Clostridiales bacterium]|nr:binding-protein-dependent transport system inner rane component [Clostridiales bacterium]